MTQWFAFFKKEWLETTRSGKIIILICIFTLFGILNPAIAKLTPWMYEMMSDSLAEQGLTLNAVEVTGLTCWQQFYKNISMILIIFIVMNGSIMTAEYQRGTLIPVLTKGFSRFKVITAKTAICLILWSVCYWENYGITYGYSAYFWDNSNVSHLFLGAVCIYLLGIWLLSILLLASAALKNNVGVLMFVGAGFLISYLLQMVPDISEYVPTYLLNAQNIITETAKAADFTWSILITIGLTIITWILSVIVFNKRIDV